VVAEKFVTLEIWVIEGIFTEEDPGIATGHDKAPQSHYQGIPQPPVGDTFKSLHDTSVSTVPRKTKHHHCGDFWVEIISCENKGVTCKCNIQTSRVMYPTYRRCVLWGGECFQCPVPPKLSAQQNLRAWEPSGFIPIRGKEEPA
jgi:hypothetical protein